MFFTAFFATAICLLALAFPSGHYLMHVLRVSGIRVIYRGAEHLFDPTPRIFMANHQSVAPGPQLWSTRIPFSGVKAN
jgi:1-acyl-sn-glycerol-3-phosphate acyltransferase